jgi:hypothetical protein
MLEVFSTIDDDDSVPCGCRFFHSSFMCLQTEILSSNSPSMLESSSSSHIANRTKFFTNGTTFPLDPANSIEAAELPFHSNNFLKKDEQKRGKKKKWKRKKSELSN